MHLSEEFKIKTHNAQVTTFLFQNQNMLHLFFLVYFSARKQDDRTLDIKVLRVSTDYLWHKTINNQNFEAQLKHLLLSLSPS